MKKLLLVLAAFCCFFSSCEKEGSHSLDGTSWKCGSVVVYFSDGFAQYETQQPVSYSVKGNKIQFSRNLASTFRGGTSWEFDNCAVLDKDRTSFTIDWWITKGDGDPSGTSTFIRVIK